MKYIGSDGWRYTLYKDRLNFSFRLGTYDGEDDLELKAQGRFYEISQKRKSINSLPFFHSIEDAKVKSGFWYVN